MNHFCVLFFWVQGCSFFLLLLLHFLPSFWVLIRYHFFFSFSWVVFFFLLFALTFTHTLCHSCTLCILTFLLYILYPLYLALFFFLFPFAVSFLDTYPPFFLPLSKYTTMAGLARPGISLPPSPPGFSLVKCFCGFFFFFFFFLSYFVNLRGVLA
jgi:hypothetical protein